ncbi:HNH endonuclease [Paraburkholderia sp. EG287A]|uniref:HNH endonuclease n=1 Tax=unclassified Paraburkholderia TaxID=2615204 RepID=UPI0034D218DD
MIELWEGQCAVTGAYTLRALVASHAKPWTDSTDVKKLDPSNGLLLAGTLEKIYDGYLMSVHPETGELLFSDAIDEAERSRLAGEHTRMRKTPTAEQAVYLGAHYQRVLAKKVERSSKLRN